MEHCFNSKKHWRSRRIYTLLLLCEGGVVAGIGGWILFSLYGQKTGLLSAVMCIALITLGCLIAYFGLFYYTVYSREYTIDSNGVAVRYLKRYEKVYSWTEISEISICDVHHAPKDHTNFDVVIRLVVGLEKNGPISQSQFMTLSGFARWRSFEYGLFHYRNVILLEYTQSRLNKVQELSGKAIVDYRTPIVKKYGTS